MSHSQDEAEGFIELLDVAGRSFAFGATTFRGLVKRLQPVNESFDLTPTDDDTVQLSAFRAEVPVEVLRIGATFTDADGFHYRVTRLQRSPNNLIVRLECAVLNP